MYNLIINQKLTTYLLDGYFIATARLQFIGFFKQLGH